MGQETALLLVSRRAALIGGAALALAACGRRGQGRVDPREYDAFFLWAGVRAPGWLARAKTIYALCGEVRAADPSRLAVLRAAPRGVAAELWLVVRTERLDWTERTYGAVLAELDRWASANPHVAGLQVDFDAATRGLAGYVAFLQDLRRRLPSRFQLSITGLMDWSANGDPAALAVLAGVVDEVVVQTYQGRSTIPGYENYLARLGTLPIPFKVALAQGGEWREPPGLRRAPHFRGFVVFLLAPAP
ncbi:DUF3142 domain-containing protein [Novosphingobium sp.]|uniref:DUF3142 domain-containing protein n=1 Tax=Novosphingobium sp. TaxID=1874826 RepID=UPI0035B2726F